ncbi:cation-transporting atpase 4 protein [Fusarium langsethiae]|uniref:Cation-transporting atpase 4 protein n=1 Tax=Fusarium langsethiae TaxID=179993 RepID=A0A0M9EM22_FUSLA|nr:cation-transporting atpase 4 protein [Fusarium langsethiae]
MIITFVSGIGSMAGIVASCSPPSAFWDSSTGTCNALINTTAAYFISACSILTDFALAILPGFMLWKVQMRRSAKVSVAIILSFAALYVLLVPCSAIHSITNLASASCATIVRLRYLLALLDSQDFLKHSAKIAIWTVIELAIGIFAGSAPALRPLLKYLPFVGRTESHSYHKSHEEARGHIKMDTYGSGTFAKSMRNPTTTNVLGDGSSQEYILDGPSNTPGGIQVRKDVSIKTERLA